MLVKTKQNKTKFITFRVSDADVKTIKAIKYHFKTEGIKINISEVVRDVLLKIPIQ